MLADGVLVAEAFEVSDDADFKGLGSQEVLQHVQNARSLQNATSRPINDSPTLGLTDFLRPSPARPDLVVRDIVKHLLDLHRILYVSGDRMGGGEGVHLHGLKAFPQKEVVLGHKRLKP